MDNMNRVIGKIIAGVSCKKHTGRDNHTEIEITFEDGDILKIKSGDHWGYYSFFRVYILSLHEEEIYG